jgi:hypothetical protein
MGISSNFFYNSLDSLLLIGFVLTFLLLVTLIYKLKIY